MDIITLMRTLGQDAVVLEGEAARGGAVWILTPVHLDSTERYDLLVNVDDLTGMGRETAMSKNCSVGGKAVFAFDFLSGFQ